MSKRQKNIPMNLLAISLLATAGILAGCQSDPAAPTELPVAKATAEVINLHTTDTYPEYDGACQTNGLVEFRAFEGDAMSGTSAGDPVVLEWSFFVDRGIGLEPAQDWGPGKHVWVDNDTSKPMAERLLALNLLTIGFHEVTLTVRTRDGRSTSTMLTVLVTSCEDCG